MFKQFYKDIDELSEAIKRIRNVWIPLKREPSVIIKNGWITIYPVFTHYMNLDNGDVDYCCISSNDKYAESLLHFEGQV